MNRASFPTVIRGPKCIFRVKIVFSRYAMSTRKTLSYADKVKLIEAVESGDKKISDIAKEFGIPANTFIYNNKKRIKV